MTEVRAEDATPRDVAAAADLLSVVFPKAPRLDRDWLSWSYLACPLGPSVFAGAWDGGRLAAQIAGRPLLARLRGCGDSVRGALLHHAATAPAFRRRGLLVRVVEAALAHAAASGAAFAVAVLNQNSVHAFVERLGFTSLGPLSVRVAVGPRSVRVAAADAADFEPVHEPGWLAWRLAPPGSPYRVRRALHAEEIWTASGIPGIPMLLGQTPAGGAASELPVAHAVLPVHAWAGRDPGRRDRTPLAIGVPLALRPSPLHLVFRALEAGAAPPAPDRVRFDAIDFDAW